MAIKHLAFPQKLTFKRKKKVAPGVYSFIFTPDEPISWFAGQHGIFEIPLINGKTGRKPFSISSAPSEGDIALTTRIRPKTASKFKKSLAKLNKGDSVRLRGPIGRMYIKDPFKNYAVLASGIGITPFRSILKQLYLDNQATKVTVFYAGNKENHFFRDEFSEINSKMPNIKFVYIYLPERIRGQNIEETLGPELAETIFFVAGSSNMVKSLRRTLTGLSVPKKHIKSSSFLRLVPITKPANTNK